VPEVGLLPPDPELLPPPPPQAYSKKLSNMMAPDKLFFFCMEILLADRVGRRAAFLFEGYATRTV
jgi:hypothetical protein